MLRVDGETEYKGELTAGQMRVTVWSNIPFEVVIPEDARSWVTLASEVVEPEAWSSQEIVLDIAAAADFRMTQVSLATGVTALNQTLVIQQGEAKLLLFPDDNFREYLFGLGYIMVSGDGYLLTAEGAAATALDTYTTLWSKGGIASAEGIEAFTNLTTLNCMYGAPACAGYQYDEGCRPLQMCAQCARNTACRPECNHCQFRIVFGLERRKTL